MTDDSYSEVHRLILQQLNRSTFRPKLVVMVVGCFNNFAVVCGQRGAAVVAGPLYAAPDAHAVRPRRVVIEPLWP